MSLFSYFKHDKRKTIPVLALDIGTEFAKAVLCEVVPGERKVIVSGAGKQRQNLGDMQAGSILDIANVIENCHHAIQTAEREAGIKAEQMLLGIGGELIKGKSTVVNMKREDGESKIELSELKNIVHKVQWQAFDQIRKELALETGQDEIEVKLVNAAITKVEIDGQVAANPLGFQGKNLTLHVFNAFAPLTHFGAMQTVAAELRKDLLGIIAQPYALSRALANEDGGSLSAIFIDIGGGTTDIAIVENGSVIGMKMFGLAGRTFTKRISANLNISFREAEKIKLTYAENGLDKPSTQIVSSLMQADTEIWLTGVELALKEFNHLDSLPSRILLCGGGSRLPEIKQALEGKKWLKDLNFAQKPRIQFIETKEVGNIEDHTERLKDPEDLTPLALANLTPELAGEEPMIQKILRNMTNLIQS